MSDYRFDKLSNDFREERRRRGDDSFETTRICPVCADVDCLEHADHVESSPGELMAAEVRRMAPVLSVARATLNAWDVSENVPPRLIRALADLSDALAKYDDLPF
jgi:hypothetical protein